MSQSEVYYGNSTITEENLAALKLFQDYPDGLLEFATLCCMVFIIIGIPGNLITIIALTRCKKVRNATAIFIINLSFCDLLYCCFCLPLSASTFWSRTWPHGVLLCRLFPLARFALAAVSLLTVLAITTNRFVLISYPQLYNKLYKTRNLAAIVITIWIFSFGALIPTWLEIWGRFGMDPVTGLCSVLPDDSGRSPEILLFLCAFFIPCLTILVCYSRIFYVVRKTTRNSRSTVRRKRTTIFEDSSLGTSTIENSPIRGTPSNTENESITIGEHLRVQSLRDGPTSLVRFSTSLEERPSGSPTPNHSLLRKSFRSVLHLRKSQLLDKSLPSSKDRRLLTMISAIMLSFLICHLPITVIKVYHHLSPHPVPFIMGTILRYMTTCINPIIYVVMSNEYRKAYKKSLTFPSCGETLCHHWR